MQLVHLLHHMLYNICVYVHIINRYYIYISKRYEGCAKILHFLHWLYNTKMLWNPYSYHKTDFVKGLHLRFKIRVKLRSRGKIIIQCALNQVTGDLYLIYLLPFFWIRWHSSNFDIKFKKSIMCLNSNLNLSFVCCILAFHNELMH